MPNPHLIRTTEQTGESKGEDQTAYATLAENHNKVLSRCYSNYMAGANRFITSQTVILQSYQSLQSKSKQ